MKIHKYFNFTFRLNDCFCAFFYVQYFYCKQKKMAHLTVTVSPAFRVNL